MAPKRGFKPIKVTGDGDCLVHALGHHDGYDGGALRIDVADFLRENASVPRGLMAASFFLSFESFDLYDLF